MAVAVVEEEEEEEEEEAWAIGGPDVLFPL
jgi:hypothetical protein